MNLGNTIYRLRTERKLSQGDLADVLDVSRQSVSKWENGSAVPELDKLIKMSRLFGVTLDELANGENGNAPFSTPHPNLPPEIPSTSTALPGIIFLCSACIVFLFFTFFYSFISGVFYSLPLVTCAVLCFRLKRRRGLWCCWVLFFSITTWIFAGTGVGIQWFWVYLTAVLTSPTGFISMLFGFAINAALIGISYWTFRSYLRKAMLFVIRRRVNLLLGWCLCIVPAALQGVISSFHALLVIRNDLLQSRILQLIQYLLSWVQLAGYLTMSILTIACLHSVVKAKKAG